MNWQTYLIRSTDYVSAPNRSGGSRKRNAKMDSKDRQVEIIGVVSYIKDGRRVVAPQAVYSMSEVEGGYRLLGKNGPAFNLSLHEVAECVERKKMKINVGSWP